MDKMNESFLAQRALAVPGRMQQISTRIAFFIAGFGIAAWAPLIPYAKDRLGLDEGVLGLLLLCLGAGSIITMPIAGALAARFGCRLMIGAATLLICASLPFLAIAASVPALVIVLLIFGAAIGAVDVVVNIQAVIVEKASGKAMMSGFHGLWSVGGFVGAGGVSGLLWMGVSPLVAVVCVVVVIIGLLLTFGKYLLPYGTEDKDGPLFVLPKGIVLFIGFLCFIVFLAEGSMLDWSAIFLTSLRGVDFSQAGLGYSLFSVTMMIGRLSGDRIVQKFGGKKILIFGGICAASGIAIAVFIPTWIASLIGFGLVGLGSSNIVPVLYSVLGRQKAMPANLAVSAVTTLGYSGILVGPALIGAIAHTTSLSFAFLVVAAMLLVVAASSRVVAES
ncbi:MULTISPECIES: MFS transporter [Pelosinus]|uniref:Major facilitator superfamily MFS_1 n=1 Tax=Pelosinus fermentans B4 TaxID=1149862 RepID=I9LHY6_9FIRM|nr:MULTISPECIES: MFS transporter [Pelosinus]EIW20001.1 major facilitator superfamily MFS_1 [Pelosinus fermentans B4]EIW21518.1 major facilitator superfamily MFS_1 [Pelosinus fermentans A11]OAM95081.1 major facilitator superfamily MFS_1 [Pelosinus fermentans DSM 17108]SDR23018.1 Predicted arabinose efflux permease, MFS family [Pelosinus fermentans]